MENQAQLPVSFRLTLLGLVVYRHMVTTVLYERAPPFQIIAELRFAHLASCISPPPFALVVLAFCTLHPCRVHPLQDVQIWHTRDSGLRDPAIPRCMCYKYFFFSSLTHSRPWSAAVHSGLPRCDDVRSDPSCSVNLQMGMICWRQSYPRFI